MLGPKWQKHWGTWVKPQNVSDSQVFSSHPDMLEVPVLGRTAFSLRLVHFDEGAGYGSPSASPRDTSVCSEPWCLQTWLEHGRIWWIVVTCCCRFCSCGTCSGTTTRSSTLRFRRIQRFVANNFVTSCRHHADLSSLKRWTCSGLPFTLGALSHSAWWSSLQCCRPCQHEARPCWCAVPNPAVLFLARWDFFMAVRIHTSRIDPGKAARLPWGHVPFVGMYWHGGTVGHVLSLHTVTDWSHFGGALAQEMLSTCNFWTGP